MQLPALKNTVPASLIDGMSIEDFIRNSTTNLQRIPTGGARRDRHRRRRVSWVSTARPASGSSTGSRSRRKTSAASWCRSTACSRAISNGPTRRRCRRSSGQLLGVQHDEPMSERLLPKPLSPGAYKKETDGPSYQLGFVGYHARRRRHGRLRALLDGRPRRRSTPWRRPPPRRSSPSARSSTR